MEPGDNHRPRRWLAWLGASAGYLLIALLVTYPGIRFLSSRLMGWGDAWVWTWIFDWFFRALFGDGGNLWHPTVLFYPNGYDFGASLEGVLSMLVSLPLTAVFRNPILTYNLVVFTSFLTSALAMFALVKKLTAHHPTAFLAGLAFAFSPLALVRATAQTNLIFIGVFPIICLASFRLFERQRITSVLAVSGSLALAAMSSWYYALVGWTLWLILFGFAMSERRGKERSQLIRGGIAASIVGILLTLFVGWPMFSALMNGNVANLGDVVNGADLLEFILPPRETNFGAMLHTPPISNVPFYDPNHAVSLGFLELVLGGVAFWVFRRDRKTWVWLTILIAGIALTLGPFLGIAGRTAFFDGQLRILLPYAILNKIPLIQLGWAPDRFAVLAHFGLTLLWAPLFAKWMKSVRLFRRRMVFTGVFVFLLAERLTLPYWSEFPPVAPFFEQLGRDPSSYALAMVPVGVHTAFPEPMYLQMISHKPFTEGYINHTAFSLTTMRYLSTGPLAPFRCEGFPEEAWGNLLTHPPSYDEFAQTLRADNIRYLLVFRPILDHPLCREAVAALRTTLGDRKPDVIDPWYDVYDLDPPTSH